MNSAKRIKQFSIQQNEFSNFISSFFNINGAVLLWNRYSTKEAETYDDGDDDDDVNGNGERMETDMKQQPISTWRQRRGGDGDFKDGDGDNFVLSDFLQYATVIVDDYNCVVI